MTTKVWMGLFLALHSWLAHAQGAIPTCYNSTVTAVSSQAALELFVLIDQTTLLDTNLQQAVANQVRPFLAPGNAFSVVVFSAFMQGKYTQVLASGHLDAALSKEQRNAAPKSVLAKFDQCFTRQPQQAAQVLGAALRSGFGGSSTDVQKSDILASLKDISSKVRQSSSKEKVVLLVSDMLENSSVTSFYANNAIRKIDPPKEMQLVSKGQFLADFDGARIYVLGAGLLSASGKSSQQKYRDPKTMQALSSFWQEFFSQSNGKLLEVGTPDLLNQIK